MSLYGWLAEFDDPERLKHAAQAARDEGYTRIEAYTPFPVKGLDEILHTSTPLPGIVLFISFFLMLAAFYTEFYSDTTAYILNVGGRPLNSWPAFMPVTFEVTVLCAAYTSFVVMLWQGGMPRLYHPLFNSAHFQRASQDRYFLCIEADDPRYDRERTRRFLESQAPTHLEELET